MRRKRRSALAAASWVVLVFVLSTWPSQGRADAQSSLAVPLHDSLGSELQLAARSGRALRLPAGEYRLTQPLQLPPRSTLELADGAVLRGSIAGEALVRMSSGSTLSGGMVENISTADGLGVDLLPAASDVRITGVRFSGDHMNAVYLNQPRPTHVRIDANTFDGVAYGVLLNPGAVQARDIRISRNRFVRVSGDAIEINAAVRWSKDRARNVRVVSNRVERMRGQGDSSGFGVGLAGVVGFRVAWNRFSQARTEAVHLEDHTARGVVAANIVQGGGSGGRPSIAIYRSVDDVIVRHNVIGAFSGSGIAALWDSHGSSTRIRIEHNLVERIPLDAVVVGGGVGTGPFAVTDNLLRDIGGNGVAVLGSHDRSIVHGNTILRAKKSAVIVRPRGRGTRLVDNRGPQKDAAQVLGSAVVRAVNR